MSGSAWTRPEPRKKPLPLWFEDPELEFPAVLTAVRPVDQDNSLPWDLDSDQKKSLYAIP